MELRGGTCVLWRVADRQEEGRQEGRQEGCAEEGCPQGPAPRQKGAALIRAAPEGYLRCLRQDDCPGSRRLRLRHRVPRARPQERPSHRFLGPDLAQIRLLLRRRGLECSPHVPVRCRWTPQATLTPHARAWRAVDGTGGSAFCGICCGLSHDVRASLQLRTLSEARRVPSPSHRGWTGRGDTGTRCTCDRTQTIAYCTFGCSSAQERNRCRAHGRHVHMGPSSRPL